MPAIATLTSPDDDGRTVTSNVSTKFKIGGLFVAFLGSILTGHGTATLVAALSTKTKVEGKFVGMVGSMTDEGSTIIAGATKMQVI